MEADIAEAIVERFATSPVVLVGHDMGSSVATELLARDIEGRLSFELASTLLFNASLVRERASLLWGQKLLLSRLGPVAARLTSESGFPRQFAGIFSREHPLSDEEAADQWSLLAHNGGHRMLDRLIFYNHERVGAPGQRWHEALRDWPGRVELAWAELDPICTEAVLQAVLELRPRELETSRPVAQRLVPALPGGANALGGWRVSTRRATDGPCCGPKATTGRLLPPRSADARARRSPRIDAGTRTRSVRRAASGPRLSRVSEPQRALGSRTRLALNKRVEAS